MKRIIGISAAISIGLVFFFVPASLFTLLAVTVVILLGAGGSLKILAGSPNGAPSIAAIAVVAILCATAIVMYSMSVSAPIRISEADLQKAIAVATVAERTRMGIDVQNAGVRAATAERELKVATAQRNDAEKHWQEWQAYAKTQEQALAKLNKEYASLRLVAAANAAIVTQTRPDIRARVEARGEPEPKSTAPQQSMRIGEVKQRVLLRFAGNDGGYMYADVVAHCDGSTRPLIDYLPSSGMQGGSWLRLKSPYREQVASNLCAA